MMKPLIHLGLFLCMALAAVASAQHGPAWTGKISLGGEWDWKTAQLSSGDADQVRASDQGWKTMQVPSNWFLQGDDLSGQVWMRKRFFLSDEYHDSTAQLIFEGVDYTADVWLNGTYLGFHEGYFAPFRFDVSRLLRTGSVNVLLVRVNSPNEEFGHAWSLHKRLIKGVFNHHDTRPGGAWSERGQEENTGGIWAPVYLRITNLVSISGFRVAVRPSSAAAEVHDGYDWKAETSLTIDNPGQEARPVNVEVNFQPINFVPASPSEGGNLQAVILHPGRNAISIRAVVRNTQRWWSWDQGEQPLYRVTIRVVGDDLVLDQTDGEVGFRTVKVAPNASEWRLNGRRIFLRGTNYISTQWLSEMTPERYDFDLALVKRANVNAIRVHAHIEAQAFYDACDRFGVLVWQDFPLQWGYSEVPEFETQAVSQAVDMVDMLFDHPSLIAWSMHNEPPWDAPWMQYKYKDYDPQQNKRVDQNLFDAVSAADPDRYVHLASETSEHPWLGWYSGDWKDYGKPTKQSLITEYGAQALPNVASLEKIVGEANLWPDSDAKWDLWEFHNFERHETFDLAHVPKGTNTSELIANTQGYQAKVIKFAAESYRRQRFQPVAAIFQFMFVEDWPSMNWGVLDYWRHEKPGYAALAEAYQPVLPSVAWDGTDWTADSDMSVDLWAINDLPTPYPNSRYVAELSCEGIVLQKIDIPIELEADNGKKIAGFVQRRIQPGSYVFSTRIEDASGQTLGRDSLSFEVKAADKSDGKKQR